jgi:purine-binding chemotaxis protein CheW
MRALLLPLGAEWYAVELATVREVLRRPEITPLPGAPPTVLGVLNVRGEVVPALDTAALLELGALDAAPFVAVLDTVAGPGALGAAGEPRTAILERPAGEAEGPCATGRYAVDGLVVTLLDVEALLAAT